MFLLEIKKSCMFPSHDLFVFIAYVEFAVVVLVHTSELLKNRELEVAEHPMEDKQLEAETAALEETEQLIQLLDLL